MRAITHGASRKAAKRSHLRLGWALARDRRVPAGKKALALGVGTLMTALLIALEVPLEAVVAFFLPIVGDLIDFAIDGVEVLLLPILFASMTLPHLLPKHLVREIRRSSSQPAAPSHRLADSANSYR